MPNRILKESICGSDNLDRLTAFEETFFYRLLVNCDDYGRMDARLKILASKLYPLKDIGLDRIDEALRALNAADLVILYEVDGRPFLQMKTWDLHQRIRAKKSKYPAPDDGTRCHVPADDGACSRNPIRNQSGSCTEGEARPRAWAPPTPGEVADYAREQGLRMDADRFVDFYASKGWRVGKEPMADWRASARLWAKRDDLSRPPPGGERTVSAQRYDQRLYTEEELAALAGDPVIEALERARA